MAITEFGYRIGRTVQIKEGVYPLNVHADSYPLRSTRGRGVDGTPPQSFDMLQYFETFLPLVESL